MIKDAIMKKIAIFWCLRKTKGMEAKAKNKKTKRCLRENAWIAWIYMPRIKDSTEVTNKPSQCLSGKHKHFCRDQEGSNPLQGEKKSADLRKRGDFLFP